MRYLSGLLPQHPYAIPYHFTDPEAQAWIGSQADNIPLQSYLAHPEQSPAGLMVPDGYAQIIVWVNASGKTHVIDATNMGVAKHVNDAAYQSPDSSTVLNAYDEMVKFVQNLVGGVAAIGSALPYIAAGVGLLWLLK